MYGSSARHPIKYEFLSAHSGDFCKTVPRPSFDVNIWHESQWGPSYSFKNSFFATWHIVYKPFLPAFNENLYKVVVRLCDRWICNTSILERRVMTLIFQVFIISVIFFFRSLDRLSLDRILYFLPRPFYRFKSSTNDCVETFPYLYRSIFLCYVRIRSR